MDEALQAKVFKRDGQQCVAPWLGADSRCATMGTQMPRAGNRADFEIDHVRFPHGLATRMAPQGGYGKRPPDDAQHLVTLCWLHHQGNGWATSHRYVLRVYLLWQALREHVLARQWDHGPSEAELTDWWDRMESLAEERP